MLRYLEGKPELPTAFFADNDNLALGAMKALQESGYRVPQDVSMIGFDDLPFLRDSSAQADKASGCPSRRWEGWQCAALWK